MEAVKQLQAAGFGLDAPGARPGRFYDFREVRRRTPTDPDLNTFRPDADKPTTPSGAVRRAARGRSPEGLISAEDGGREPPSGALGPAPRPAPDGLVTRRPDAAPTVHPPPTAAAAVGAGLVLMFSSFFMLFATGSVVAPLGVAVN